MLILWKKTMGNILDKPGARSHWKSASNGFIPFHATPLPAQWCQLQACATLSLSQRSSFFCTWCLCPFQWSNSLDQGGWFPQAWFWDSTYQCEIECSKRCPIFSSIGWSIFSSIRQPISLSIGQSIFSSIRWQIFSSNRWSISSSSVSTILCSIRSSALGSWEIPWFVFWNFPIQRTLEFPKMSSTLGSKQFSKVSSNFCPQKCTWWSTHVPSWGDLPSDSSRNSASHAPGSHPSHPPASSPLNGPLDSPRYVANESPSNAPSNHPILAPRNSPDNHPSRVRRNPPRHFASNSPGDSSGLSLSWT